MTDTTHKAPERIWVDYWLTGKKPRQVTEEDLGGCTEYVRADLVQAAVAAALTEAAVNLRTYAPHLVDGPEHDVGYYYGYHTALNRILALITPDAQAALDRVVAAERERGFWLGRSCGGSKAEIDAALAAIREGGE